MLDDNRCHVCDREKANMRGCLVGHPHYADGDWRARQARDDCDAHAVNWRERCRGRDALLLDCRTMLDHLIRLRPGRAAEYPGPEAGWRDTPEARALSQNAAVERGTASALADNAARDQDRDDYKALRARISAALGEV